MCKRGYAGLLFSGSVIFACQNVAGKSHIPGLESPAQSSEELSRREVGGGWPRRRTGSPWRSLSKFRARWSPGESSITPSLLPWGWESLVAFVCGLEAASVIKSWIIGSQISAC